MDDRKRPALDDLAAGRGKRQAVESNGTPVKAEEELTRDEDLDRFTKDAILRQMKEYKRERQTLEQELAKVNKRSLHHDEHLRIIDAWFLQLLDELSVLQNAPPPVLKPARDVTSTLISAEPKKFQEHLGERSKEIKGAITQLFSQTSTPTADVKKLQERVNALLAAEKVHAAELQKALSEHTSLDERLFSATTRYMTAEKALDRARSTQVAKLEAMAMASSRPESAQKTRASSEDENVEGALGVEAIEFLRKEAQAVAEKQKGHVDKLAEENKKLTDDLTAAAIKLNSISDDDYANTDLFKHFKAQHADAIKRLNDLEARFIELQEEAKTLRAERTEYRDRVDNEFRDQDVAMQSEIGQKDADLTRVRSQRDELNADITVLRATAEAFKESHDRFRELAESRQSRINALESEVERLRGQGQQAAAPVAGDGTLEARIKSLEQEKLSFDQELRSMETAYKKASQLASSKVNELLGGEERLRVTMEEKAKADQKYFSARKLIDSRDAQFRDMQRQVSKSSEIISTLKEAESSCRALLVTAEKQLAEAKDSLQLVTNQQRVSQQTIADHKATADRVTAQVEEFQKLLTSKDEALQVAKKGQRDSEIRAEQLQLEVTQLSKDVDTWKRARAGANQSEELAILKKLVYCTVCDEHIKDTFITKCKHVMCRNCVDKQIKLRERRCPICATSYGINDMTPIVL